MVDHELIFVYNANSGRLNSYLHGIHKIVSPKTYMCSLCAITYGNFSMEKEWKEFVETSSVSMRFLHKDEWIAETGREDVLPAVFERSGTFITQCILESRMNELTLDELKGEVESIIDKRIEK